MIPVVQSRMGKRNGTCFRAALASILELGEQDVPDFGGDDPDEAVYWGRVDSWLAGRGLRYKQVPIIKGAAPPLGWHTIEGLSPRGGNHAVVGYNGQFVHDPHPSWDDPRRGLVRPSAWGLLLPLSKTQRAKDALRGKELLKAVEPVYAKHDDVKYDSRRAERDRAETAYRSAERDVASLIRDAEALLTQSRLPDKPAWRERLARAKVALEYARR